MPTCQQLCVPQTVVPWESFADTERDEKSESSDMHIPPEAAKATLSSGPSSHTSNKWPRRGLADATFCSLLMVPLFEMSPALSAAVPSRVSKCKATGLPC